MHWSMYAASTILCWGLYIVTLHRGQAALERSGPHAFLFVGLAYFLVAVLVPGGIIVASADWKPFSWNGALLCTGAGLLGALGALGIIYALRSGGSPLIVPSLVFAGAPVVNVFAALLLRPPEKAISPMFWVACGLLSVGTFLFMYYRPT